MEGRNLAGYQFVGCSCVSPFPNPDPREMMRRAIVVLTLLAAACTPAPRPSPAPVRSAAGADADELAVMALVVDSVLAQPDQPFLVMADSTSSSHLDAEQLANFVPAMDATARAQIIADFGARNATPSPTPTAIPATSVIRISNISRIFAAEGDFGAKWETFFTRFAPVRAYSTLSHPGFDAARRNAVIATGTVCGGRCGQGRLIVLRKMETGWTIAQRVDTWIS